MDNLYWDWKILWRRQRLYFGWTQDTGCATEIRFHCRVRGMTDIPYCSYCHCYWHIVIVIVIIIDYLAVGRGSAPGNWAVLPGMYGTHLKYGQCLKPISFNEFRISIDTCSRCSMGCTYYRWQLVFADIINNVVLWLTVITWLNSYELW